MIVRQLCRRAVLVVSSALLLTHAGCHSSVDSSTHHTSADGGTSYDCPDDPPDPPQPECDSTFGSASWGGGGFCGPKVNSSCEVITPISPNTACDDKGKDVGDKEDEFLNCECELNNKKEEYAEKEAEYLSETQECSRAETEAEAQCHCPKADMARQEADQLYYVEIPQQEQECRCDWDQLSNALCEFANCMKGPDCNCAAGLNHGSGGTGSSCSTGSQCQSGLCTVDAHMPYKSDGSVNWTCAAPPPDLCCLTFADGACSYMGSSGMMCAGDMGM
jgi:hypothetical protein